MGKFRLKVKNQEKRAADFIGGKRQPGSGAFYYAKGDAISEDYCAECKRTDKKSISIKADVLDKVTQEAASHGKHPLLFLELPTVAPFTDKDWVLIEARHFMELREKGVDDEE